MEVSLKILGVNSDHPSLYGIFMDNCSLIRRGIGLDFPT